MYYTIKSEPALKQQTDCLILPIFTNHKLSPALQALDTASQGYISQWLKEDGIEGKLGQLLLLHQVPNLPAKRLLLVGADDPTKLTPTRFEKILNAAFRQVAQMGLKECTAYLIDLPFANKKYLSGWQIRQAVLLTEQLFYRFDQFKSQPDPAPKVLQTITLATEQPLNLEHPGETYLAQAQAIWQGMKVAKDLANLPSNVCTPAYFAEWQSNYIQSHSNLSLEVFDEHALEKMQMQGILSVGKGSANKPRLITLTYKGAEGKPVVFVGKGITFDSGGISLKPGLGMDEMKYDMCGAANVLGILIAAAELKLPIHIVGVMALAENMPSSHAYKPGDVIKTYSGQTIEVLNTDAEGRVVLSDALAYCEKFNPDVVIDMATLTGAIIIALGDKASGLMCNDDELAEAIITAGEESWDRVWRLPIWEEYQDQIKSSIADVANIGEGGAKSITAACFLENFARKYRWAHLDIAGTAWKSGKEKGATGRAIPLLMQFLFNRCGNA